MNTAERLEQSQRKEKETIASAMEYSIKHLESFIVSLQPGTKGKRMVPSYTKSGPGRYHQSKSKSEIRRLAELQNPR